MGIRGLGQWPEENPHEISKTIPCHVYWLYEKGMTWPMVGLQRIHTSDAFGCSNISANMGLKSFCPWCLKLVGTLKQLSSILREVHYRMAIVCEVCQSFASMNTQHILDHHSGCKAKCDRDCMEQERQEKMKKLHKKKSKSQERKERS